MSDFNHRVCPATGLRIHKSAENLIKANAVTAIVFLAVGGFFGLMVALTRWPGVHLLPAEWFYLVLTGHGLDVLLVWIIFFEGLGRVRADAGRRHHDQCRCFAG
jgi:cytochrome c oxidase subunit 1